MSIGRVIFRMGFEISPIILTNGIAAGIPGGMLPIVALTEATSFISGLLHGKLDIDLDQYFAHFRPLPGATLQNNQYGNYPFANQSVAANAGIAEPRNISMLMTCPVNKSGGYTNKLTTFSALNKALDSHFAAGGTFTIATPSHIYTNCLLVALRDISSGASKQVQNEWQFDFIQPLVSSQDAQRAQNGLLSKISSGSAISGAPGWSGAASSVGSQISGAASSIVTGAKNLVGTATSSVSSGVSSVKSIL